MQVKMSMLAFRVTTPYGLVGRNVALTRDAACFSEQLVTCLRTSQHGLTTQKNIINNCQFIRVKRKSVELEKINKPYLR
jgi:hypothetical protein